MTHHRPVAAVGVPFLLRMRDCVARHEADFGVVTAREDHPGGPHGDSQSVFLRAPPWPLGAHSQDDMRVVQWPALQSDPALATMLAALEQLVALPMARAMFVSLCPGGIISAHRDEGPYAEATQRFHLPIITGAAAMSRIGDEEVHMEAGVLYHFDHRSEHAGRNDEPVARVHLIFDGWTQC